MEERKEGKKGEKGSIRYFPTIFFWPRSEKREGQVEKSEEKVLVFLYLYIFMFYIYILSSCI